MPAGWALDLMTTVPFVSVSRRTAATERLKQGPSFPEAMTAATMKIPPVSHQFHSLALRCGRVSIVKNPYMTQYAETIQIVLVKNIFALSTMPAYHSQFNQLKDVKLVGNVSMLAVKTKLRGPAPPYLASAGNDEDIIDEALNLYRANCFFKNFEIQGPADRLLIYVTLFVGECLVKIGSQCRGESCPSLAEAQKTLNNLALANFSLPGDAGFPLNAMYDKPADRNEQDLMKSYLSQVRQEVASRLCEKIYSSSYSDTAGGKRPTKWWLAFQKRKFMNKSL